jgi:hypothetical protein
MVVPAGVRRVRPEDNSSAGVDALQLALEAEDKLSRSTTASDTNARGSMLQEDFIPGLTYEYFSGTFEELPNFDELKPSQSGITPLCSLQTLVESGIISTEARAGMHAQHAAR